MLSAARCAAARSRARPARRWRRGSPNRRAGRRVGGVMAPSPLLEGYDWASQKMLSLRRGRGQGSDHVSITGAFAGIAETGTLVMASGPDHPVSLNLLPDTHIVVLRESDIVAGYEDVWARLRQRYGKDAMPRTVNTITGPS